MTLYLSFYLSADMISGTEKILNIYCDREEVRENPLKYIEGPLFL